MGAAVAAVVVNLLAAGGIGIPTVALGLWATLAIGLNLRDDRPCGRLREYASRIPPFVLSTVWAAALGLFLGAVIPFWRAEAAIAEAEDAMRAAAARIRCAPRPPTTRHRGGPILRPPLAPLCRARELAWEWRGGR